MCSALRPAVSACLFALLLGACATLPKPLDAPESDAAEMAMSESDRINAWFDEKYEESLQFSPMSLTFLGRKDQYDKLDDLSIEAEDKQLAWTKASVAEMQASFDYAKLTEEAQTSYDLWKYQYDIAAAGVPFRNNGYVFEQMNGAQSFLPTFLISFHKVDDESDMEAYIARVREVPRALEQLLDRAKIAADAGIRPPRFAYEGVIDQSKKVIGGAPFTDGEDSSIWADMQSEIDTLVENEAISAERASELKAESKAALMEAFLPAYQELIAWIDSELPKTLVNPAGIGTTQSNGKAYYNYLLKRTTTTELTADEIHQIGLSEVKRLRGEMIALKDRVGFDGDLEAFFKFLDTDPRFRYPNTDEGRQAYLDDATAAIENIKKELPNYFGTLPKADLVVKRVEAFREQDGAAQHYFPGTPDGSRPGVYYAHLSDMNAMPKTELEDIAYHEGIPGHHMQISIAQELTTLPQFRTQISFTAYVEGWGLYVEWLAKEMPNTFVDPYSEFGQLSGEIWRAVRLVVDTGLHAKGWTEQQAVDYFNTNTSISETAVRSEIQRYLVIPGQATAYKIGMLKIQELRRKAEAALGDKFDIRGFHDTVLSGGALPLEMLETRVDRWIAEQQKL